jgi:hypothetical protein
MVPPQEGEDKIIPGAGIETEGRNLVGRKLTPKGSIAYAFIRFFDLKESGEIGED